MIACDNLATGDLLVTCASLLCLAVMFWVMDR